jgi:molecular chaperone GrpE
VTGRPNIPDPSTPAVDGDELVESEAPTGASEPPFDGVKDAGESPVDGATHAAVVVERDQYLDALQRLKAEFDNYRKRVDRDREAQQLAGVRELCSELLPVVDNLERALASSAGADTDQIVVGVEMVRGQLARLLGGRGVEEIAAHDQQFDPNVHEAVAQHPSPDHEEGTVVHVLEKGYRIGETVIRTAKVVVAAPPPEV